MYKYQQSALLPLPSHLQQEVFSYDPTYRDHYGVCMKELMCPELSALLCVVKGIAHITYCKDDMTAFLVHRKDGWREVYDGVYLVLDSFLRYHLADDSGLVDEVAASPIWDDEIMQLVRLDDIDRASEIYGWPSLLSCDDRFERQVTIRGTTYYIYKSIPRGYLDDLYTPAIINGLYRTDVPIEG